MRICRTFAFVLTALIVIAAAGSTMAQNSGKVGLINFSELGAKGGATRYVNALDALDKEFETELRELQTLSTSINSKTTELQNLAEQANKPGSPISRDTLLTRSNEIDALKRQFKFKQEDLQARVNSRRAAVVGPVFNELRVALNAYAKTKGYSMILDGAKLEEAGLLVAFDTAYDVTKDFISYFNARPAGSATNPQ